MLTTYTLRFYFLVAPVGFGAHRDDSEADGSDSEGDNSCDINEYEDDGFIVLSDEENCADEENCETEVCLICRASTAECEPSSILICEGCEGEGHITCAGFSEVPSSDWFCDQCKVPQSPLSSTESADCENSNDEIAERVAVAAVKKKKSRRRSANFLDSDDE